jgi:hypothetical protein
MRLWLTNQRSGKPSEYKRPNLGRYCALMPLWVLLLVVFTGKISHDSSGYRFVLALEIFLLGWGVGLGRAALANRDEGRGTPIAGLVLNTLFFLLLALSWMRPPAQPPSPVPAADPQAGRASDK